MKHDSISIKKSSFNSWFIVRPITPVTVTFNRLKKKTDELPFPFLRGMSLKWMKMFPWLTNSWNYNTGKTSQENVQECICNECPTLMTGSSVNICLCNPRRNCWKIQMLLLIWSFQTWGKILSVSAAALMQNRWGPSTTTFDQLNFCNNGVLK